MKEFCVSLNLAKELKENGFPQDTYFYHCPGKHEIGYEGENNIWDEDTWSFVDFDPKEDYISWYATDNDLDTNEDWERFKEREKYLKSISCSAPTSDEILKELPKAIDIKKNPSCDLQIVNEDERYYVGYTYIDGEFEIFKYDKKLSNALAKMWLYLKKEGYIKDNK